MGAGKTGGDLFDRLSAPEELLAGFRRLRRNRSGAGGDGETPEAFAADLDRNLLRLSGELRSGAYRPGPLSRRPIPKADGRTRWLAVPSVRDRVAQGAAAAVLGEAFDGRLAEGSFAYRPGRSVEHAAGLVTAFRLQGFVHVLDGDIADFFDGVPHAAVIACLRPHVDIRVRRLVGLWLAGFGRRRWIRAARGLAQGSPISPLLANLVLDPVDRALSGGRVRFVRYADDFLLMARSRPAAEAAGRRLVAELAALGLSLNPAKTRLTTFADGVDFLGLHFRGETVERRRAAPE